MTEVDLCHSKEMKDEFEEEREKKEDNIGNLHKSHRSLERRTIEMAKRG